MALAATICPDHATVVAEGMAINIAQFRSDLRAAFDAPEARTWLEKEWARVQAMTPAERRAEDAKRKAEAEQRRRDFAVYLCTYMGGNRQAWEDYKSGRR